MAGEPTEVFRGMLEAFNRGDVDTVVALFAEDCEVREPPEMPDTPPGGFRGHSGIRRWMANLRELAVRFEPRDLRSRGDVVVTELHSRGRGQTVGVPVEWTTFAVVHVRAGRIVKLQAFLSREEAFEAAGLET